MKYLISVSVDGKMPLSNVNSTSSASAVSSSAVTQQSVVDVKHPEYIKVKSDLEKIGCHLTKLVKLNNAILVDNFETELALLSAKKNHPGLVLSCLYIVY